MTLKKGISTACKSTVHSSMHIGLTDMNVCRPRCMPDSQRAKSRVYVMMHSTHTITHPPTPLPRVIPLSTVVQMEEYPRNSKTQHAYINKISQRK